MKKVILSAAIAGLTLASSSAMAHIEVGSDPAGGINYGTRFFIHHEGTQTATTGDSVVGGTVGQTKSGAWNSNPNPLGSGWTHNSQWASAQFMDAADWTADHGGNGLVQLTFTLTDVDAGFDWDPAMTVWSGIDNDACPTPGFCDASGGQNTHWYDNTNTVAGTGWAEDLTFLGYDTDTNSATYTTGHIDVNLVDQFTIAYAGQDGANGNGTSVDYSLAVNVSSVPVPAAVWLMGTGLLGLAGMRRKKVTA